jgi:hypothetical protein
MGIDASPQTYGGDRKALTAPFAYLQKRKRPHPFAGYDLFLCPKA